MEKVENKLKEPTASDQMLTFVDGSKKKKKTNLFEFVIRFE